jgi:hypothetical protein
MSHTLSHGLDEPSRIRTSLAGRDFLSMRDLTTEEIGELFERALLMKADPLKFSTSLRGRTLAMIFEKPSLRTRVSFDVGVNQLGGHAIDLSPEISLGRRESMLDVAKNLERMVQAIMIRTFSHDNVVQMAEFASIPIINGLTDFSHPCQALADYLISTSKNATARTTTTRSTSSCSGRGRLGVRRRGTAVPRLPRRLLGRQPGALPPRILEGLHRAGAAGHADVARLPQRPAAAAATSSCTS